MTSVYETCHNEANTLETTIQSQKYLVTAFGQELQNISNSLEASLNSMNAMKE